MKETFQGRRILLVDDESLFLRATAQALEHEFRGLTVYTASNGEQAIEVLAEASIDVLVTDLQMPVLDGYGLLARLASDGPDVPVIVMTAFSSDGARNLVSEELALELLDKPFDFAQLVSSIANVLSALDDAMPVRHVTLPGFLQLIETERQSCELRTIAPKLGWLRVSKGVVVGARTSTLRGSDAAYEMLSWRRPRFVVGDLPVAHGDFQPMSLSIAELLLESARRSDERTRFPSIDDDLAFDELLDHTDPPPQPRERRENMASVQQTIDAAYDIEGTIAVALVDWESGMCLGTRGGGAELNIEVAAAGNTEVVRAKQRVMKDLGIPGSIQDILITLAEQYHIITPIEDSSMFLYSAISRARGNLAMARMKIGNTTKELRV